MRVCPLLLYDGMRWLGFSLRWSSVFLPVLSFWRNDWPLIPGFFFLLCACLFCSVFNLLSRSAIQQLQASLRDEKAALRALRDSVDKIEQNTVSAIVDVKSSAASNKQGIEELRGEMAGVNSDIQSISTAIRSQADNIQAVDAAVRQQRDDLVQLEGAWLSLLLVCAWICFCLQGSHLVSFARLSCLICLPVPYSSPHCAV